MKSNSELIAELREVKDELHQLRADNHELKKRPKLFILEKRSNAPKIETRGVRTKAFDELIAAETYHLQIELDNGNIWEFSTMICVGTPNCSVKVAEYRYNSGDGDLIPVEIVQR